MNKWKLTFIFMTGFMLRELMGHVWISIDGMLPYTSDLLFGFTLTAEWNMLIIGVNFILLLLCAYLAFLHTWGFSARHA